MAKVQVLWRRVKFCSEGSSSVAKGQVLWLRVKFCGEGSSSVAKGQVLWQRVKFEVLSSVVKGQVARIST